MQKEALVSLLLQPNFELFSAASWIFRDRVSVALSRLGAATEMDAFYLFLLITPLLAGVLLLRKAGFVVGSSKELRKEEAKKHSAIVEDMKMKDRYCSDKPNPILREASKEIFSRNISLQLQACIKIRKLFSNLRTFSFLLLTTTV